MPVTMLDNEATTGRPPSAPPLDGWLSECRQIEEFIEQLFVELDELRCELQRKAHELEVTRAQLDEREQQLRIQGDETKQVRQILLRQDERLAAALRELVELRSVLAADPASQQCPSGAEYETDIRAEPAAEAEYDLAGDAGDTAHDDVVDSVRKQFESLRSDARR